MWWPRSEYSGSFDSGRSALRLYVRAAELARTLNDECQLAMDKEYETIDLLKSRLLVRLHRQEPPRGAACSTLLLGILGDLRWHVR